MLHNSGAKIFFFLDTDDTDLIDLCRFAFEWGAKVSNLVLFAKSNPI